MAWESGGSLTYACGRATGGAPEGEGCVRRAVLVLPVPVEHALMVQHAAAVRLYELAVRIPELLTRVEVCGRKLYVMNRLVRCRSCPSRCTYQRCLTRWRQVFSSERPRCRSAEEAHCRPHTGRYA